MFKKLRQMFSREERSDLGPNAWSVFGKTGSSGGVSGKLNVPGTSRPAENVLWVYNCMTARSEAVMQAHLRISDTNENILEGGDLYDLLAQPNRWMDGVQFVGAAEVFLTIYNSAFIVPVSENETRPDELMLLSPANMRPIVGIHRPTGKRVPMGWIHREPGTSEDYSFLMDEVIHIQNFNPHNPLLASLNPMNPLKRSLQMDLATREQNLGIFLNGGLPDIALVTDRTWNEDQAKEFLERFMDNYAGFGNAHKPALLYNGVKIDKIGLNPEELQSLDVLKTLTPQEIVSGLRTKPVMAGLMVGETGLSQGTSTEEQKIAWWSETGHSELARIASALQQFLVDPYDWSANRRGVITSRAMTRADDTELKRQRLRMRPHTKRVFKTQGQQLFIWFDTNQIPELMEHRWKRIQEYDRLAARGYLPDDLNDYFDLGLPAHPTNIGTLPFNLQSVMDLGETQEESTPPEKPRGSLPGSRRALELIDQITKRLGQEHGEVPKKWKVLRKTFDAFLKPREKAAAKKFSRFFMEQRTRVIDRLKNRTRSERDTEDELLEKIFPLDEENPSLTGRLASLWTEHLKDGWEFFNRETDQKENPFEIDDPRVTEALEGRKIQGTHINETTVEDLRNVLKLAFDEGDTIEQMADRIDNYYKTHCIGEKKHRPLTAARTQTAGIVNEGRMLAAKKLGGLKKGWLHGAPDEPRPEHLQAQATYLSNPIGLDEKFVVNGHPCDAPGSTELPVGETANCTCMVTFVAG